MVLPPWCERLDAHWRQGIGSDVRDDRTEPPLSDERTELLLAVRNRALVRVLAFSGVRGAEVFSHPDDDREGRCGIRWKNVDLDARTMLVLGKSQTWERTPLPSNCIDAMLELKEILQPASEDWPVFVSGHRPSLAAMARGQLYSNYDPSIAESDGHIWQLFQPTISHHRHSLPVALAW